MCFLYLCRYVVVALANIGAQIMSRLGVARLGLVCFVFVVLLVLFHVFISLFVLQRCYWLLCGCALWGLGAILKCMSIFVHS